jgi:hypothetical protein
VGSTHNGNNIIIRNNYLHDSVGQVLAGNGYQLTFGGKTIVHVGHFSECHSTDPTICNKDHGVYFTGTYVNVLNNFFKGNLAYGIQVAGYA